VAIADVFDALTMQRPYKDAWPYEQAMQTIRENAGHHFDPDIVQHFIALQPRIREIQQRWLASEAAAH
jgi:putative two-component system response regulator